jgi:hypothetical protein
MESIKSKFESINVGETFTFTNSKTKRVIITKGEYISTARIGENCYLFETIDQLCSEGEVEF